MKRKKLGGRPEVFFEYKGEKVSLRELCKRHNIGVSTFRNRLKRGWDLEKSLTTPIPKHRPYKTKRMKEEGNEEWRALGS